MHRLTSTSDRKRTARRKRSSGVKACFGAMRGRCGERGFSLPEMTMTIVILGILVGLAWWDLSSSNSVNSLNSANEQVKRAVSEAFSIAQNEKVKVTLSFYSNYNEDESIRNTYTISRGDPSVSMKPPKAVAFTQQGDTYYCKVLEGSSGTTIDNDQTMIFMPRGASTQCEDADGNPASFSITLSHPGTGSSVVVVNSKGAVK